MYVYILFLFYITYLFEKNIFFFYEEKNKNIEPNYIKKNR